MQLGAPVAWRFQTRFSAAIAEYAVTRLLCCYVLLLLPLLRLCYGFADDALSRRQGFLQRNDVGAL